MPLAPAQWFEGQVTFEDSGLPAAHARLTIWADSMSETAGQTDAEGRYRICPHPGVRFGINVYPPQGTPYLARQTDRSKDITWKAGERVKQVNLRLPRGVLVRGTVMEAGTGLPVVGAAIQYLPEAPANQTG